MKLYMGKIKSFKEPIDKKDFSILEIMSRKAECAELEVQKLLAYTEELKALNEKLRNKIKPLEDYALLQIKHDHEINTGIDTIYDLKNKVLTDDEREEIDKLKNEPNELLQALIKLKTENLELHNQLKDITIECNQQLRTEFEKLNKANDGIEKMNIQYEETYKQKKEKIDETQTTEDKKPKNVKATRNVSAIEKPQENITEADIKEELKQIFKQRGQNKYSLDNVERLEFLYTKTQNKLTQIEILSESTLQCFDNYSNQLSAFTSELWNKIYQDIEKMVELHDILNKEKNETNQKDIEKMNLSLQNDLSVRMEKLENELYKSLQFNTNNNAEYTNGILNEIKFLNSIKN